MASGRVANGKSRALLEKAAQTSSLRSLFQSYQLRRRRRRLLWRAFRHRRDLDALTDRTAGIRPAAILCFMAVRNEALRLPYFLDHHRRLGVQHFLIVDNGSTDGTLSLLQSQPDVSVWQTSASYKEARFGLDWITWLQMRYGDGHWCLTLDADEVLIYPYWETRPLSALTGLLDSRGSRSFGAMMLDMYPKGPVSASPYLAGQDPVMALPWFDSGNYSVQIQDRMRNLWIQGGPRARCFFADEPRRAPTLNKVPLVKWSRRYAYVNSTHALLPPALNEVYDIAGGEKISGILLHTKFLNQIIEKSREEQQRRQHFANSALYDGYYEGVIADPDLYCAASRRLTGWRQLEALGLMSRGGWV
jgi:glycosyltransferase involved in cell wall biosynthesis